MHTLFFRFVILKIQTNKIQKIKQENTVKAVQKVKGHCMFCKKFTTINHQN